VELVFPAWVFALSMHILVVSFRPNLSGVTANPAT
jgi:hypothetical protein